MNLRNPRGERRFSNLIAGPAQLLQCWFSLRAGNWNPCYSWQVHFFRISFPSLLYLLYGMCVRNADILTSPPPPEKIV